VYGLGLYSNAAPRSEAPCSMWFQKQYFCVRARWDGTIKERNLQTLCWELTCDKKRDTWNQITQQGIGFIYNDFGTQFPGDSPAWNTKNSNTLHKASCPQVKRMTFESEGKLTKYFFESRKKRQIGLSKIVRRRATRYAHSAIHEPGR